MKSLISLFLLTIVMMATPAITIDDDWIDPYDMLNFDVSAMKMKEKANAHPKTVEDNVKKDGEPLRSSGQMGEEIKKEDKTQAKDNSAPNHSESSLVESVNKNTDELSLKQKVCHNSSVYKTLYRKHVKMIMSHWDSQAMMGTSELHYVFSISGYDLKALRLFADEDKGDAHRINDILSKAIIGVEIPVSQYYGGSFMERYIGISPQTVIQILAVLALVSVILWIEMTLQICWRQKLIKLTFLAFFVSIPWTWYHMYKKEEAKRQSELMKDIPESCLKRKLSWLEMAAEVTRSMFTLSEDQCVKYYDQMLVDPVWKVAPTEALAVTFVRFFVSPAKHIGQAISEFIKGIFQELPVTLWPIMIVCGMILLILILLFVFGYSIRLPFFLTIESSHSSISKHKLEVLSSLNEQYVKQIEDLKVKLDEERHRLRSSNNTAVHDLHLESNVRYIPIPQTLPSTSDSIMSTILPPGMESIGAHILSQGDHQMITNPASQSILTAEILKQTKIDHSESKREPGSTTDIQTRNTSKSVNSVVGNSTGSKEGEVPTKMYKSPEETTPMLSKSNDIEEKSTKECDAIENGVQELISNNGFEEVVSPNAAKSEIETIVPCSRLSS